MSIEHEVQGLDSMGEFLVRVRASAEHQTRDIADRAGAAAEAEMLAKVPRSGDTTKLTIAGSIRRTTVRYAPGGAGGGGSYEVRVGPGRDAPSHLEAVLQGTGIYGPMGALIRPRPGNVLAIEKRGEGVRFRMYAKGQRPQREWYDDAVILADQIVAEGINQLDLGR